MRTLACIPLIAAMSLAVSSAAAPKEERGLSEFVSKDRGLAMEYKPIAFGDEIVLNYRIDLAAAQPTWATVRLAANR